MRKLLNSSDYVRRPWKNGRGITTEMLVWPLNSGEEFIFRLSAADLKESGPFSVFPGILRTLVLLEGPSVILMHADREVNLDLLTPYVFSGEESTMAIVQSSGRDFNLMCRRNLALGKVTVHHGKHEFTILTKFFLVYSPEKNELLIVEDESGKNFMHDEKTYLVIEIEA